METMAQSAAPPCHQSARGPEENSEKTRFSVGSERGNNEPVRLARVLSLKPFTIEQPGNPFSDTANVDKVSIAKILSSLSAVSTGMFVSTADRATLETLKFGDFIEFKTAFMTYAPQGGGLFGEGHCCRKSNQGKRCEDCSTYDRCVLPV